MADAGSHTGGKRPGRVTHAPGNRFGLAEAAFGLVGGFFLSLVAVTVYADASGHPASTSSYGDDVASLIGLWAGFLVAMVVASRLAARPEPAGAARGPSAPLPIAVAEHGSGSLVEDYGIRIRPLVDLPAGIVLGVAAQLLLVPVLEAPLRPFVPHLGQRLGHPTTELLGHVYGPGLVALAILICVGSPLLEELFFRGLMLRALLGRLAPLGRRLAPAVSIVTTGLVFGLVHFETLQFLGLAGFGILLGVLAWWTGRRGPSIVAHAAFNTTTVVAFVMTH